MSAIPMEAENPASRWVVLAIGVLAGVAAPYNFFKAAPVIPALIVEFNLTEISVSLLMTIFAIFIALLSLPAGLVTVRWGPKRVMIAGLLCIVIGSAVGATATSDLMLFWGRVPEGIGMALLMTSAPALIIPWFPSKEVGLVMAIWANFMPLGNILGLNVSGLIAPIYGWRGVWWVGFIFAVIMIFSVMMIKEKIPKKSPRELKKGNDLRNRETSPRQAIRNVDLWLVSLAFLMASGAPLAFQSLGPTYLSVEKGFDILFATFVTSLFMVSGIFGTIISGVVSDKIHSRKIVYTIGLGLSMVIYPLFPYVTGLFIPILMIIWGFVFSFAPPAILAVPADLLGPELAGIGLGVLNSVIGLSMGYPPLMWGMTQAVLGSWELGLDTFLVLSGVGVIIGWLPKKVR